jgi:AraC-like DNA-binding protein
MMQIPIESFNLQMLNVGLARHHGDWNWKDVSSPFTRIFYVKEGEALLHLPHQTQRLRAGYLYFIPAYTMHSYECDGLFVHYYLHVYEGFKSEMNLVEQYDFPTEVAGSADDELLLQRMCEQHPQAELPESNPQSYDNATHFTGYVERYRDMALWQKMELRGAILILFSRFMSQAVPHVWTADERMKRVQAYIHSHINSNIEVDELASVACVTKPYLIRLFKREFGTSPVQYVNRKKVERAQLMLYTSDLPVKEVAYALGFSDHSYFIRMYRKLTGITPQEYRERMRG